MVPSSADIVLQNHRISQSETSTLNIWDVVNTIALQHARVSAIEMSQPSKTCQAHLSVLHCVTSDKGLCLHVNLVFRVDFKLQLVLKEHIIFVKINFIKN